MNDIDNRINKVIDKIKPFLVNDGGDINYIKFENGIVYVKLLGACSHCPMMELTLKEGIESALINEIPEVTEVKSID